MQYNQFICIHLGIVPIRPTCPESPRMTVHYFNDTEPDSSGSKYVMRKIKKAFYLRILIEKNGISDVFMIMGSCFFKLTSNSFNVSNATDGRTDVYGRTNKDTG